MISLNPLEKSNKCQPVDSFGALQSFLSLVLLEAGPTDTNNALFLSFVFPSCMHTCTQRGQRLMLVSSLIFSTLSIEAKSLDRTQSFAHMTSFASQLALGSPECQVSITRDTYTPQIYIGHRDGKSGLHACVATRLPDYASCSLLKTLILLLPQAAVMVSTDCQLNRIKNPW